MLKDKDTLMSIDAQFNQSFSLFKKFGKLVIVFWVLSAVLGLGLTGVFIWFLIKLASHL